MVSMSEWDELSSGEESKDQDDSRSFATLANKVNRGLPVFNKVFTGRAEVFWQQVVKLHARPATFHQKAKVAGVTAIAGLALAPFTFGASLIATTGGIRSASGSISDNVNIFSSPRPPPILLPLTAPLLLPPSAASSPSPSSSPLSLFTSLIPLLLFFLLFLFFFLLFFFLLFLFFFLLFLFFFLLFLFFFLLFLFFFLLFLLFFFLLLFFFSFFLFFSFFFSLFSLFSLFL
ncbi:uncharacterized protein LOC144197722 [Stigmatopora nigra]